MRRILQSAVNHIAISQLNVSNEAVVPLWKEAYYSLVLLEKILNQFQKLGFEKDLEVHITSICTRMCVSLCVYVNSFRGTIL